MTAPGARRSAPRALTRAYPLPLEMLFLAAVIALWQLLRIPFEGSTRLSLAHAHDWIDLERTLHIDIEPSFLRFVHGRDWLLHAAQAFYRNLNEPVMLGFMAIARLLDPVRYPKLRTAYVLLHVPALAVLALYPLAPPHWVAGIPVCGWPAAASERAPQRDGGRGQPALRRPAAARRRRALAAAARSARVADAAVPTSRVRRDPRHGKPLRARHDRGQPPASVPASRPRRRSTGRCRAALRARAPARIALAGRGFGFVAFLVNGGFIA